ncbi:hypothetical protein [Vibrio penaeicida]|uniref:Uncharacterized protein n=1 Tax=Vibrio penaeicida TaxID=104609 RepID=A0AAV5P1J6_9VIBR|nr:hypothetical protein [Vibrio penaeicida]MDP2572706.1 hypothetical protein [Vibrio penaeicida]RTZ24108.1 hypothetical protein EKN09_05455 [Vibrio penaeicida]GLQ76324.1 hypothetical protein GCM10007932_56870 [Vibrio penaeicida]
MKVIKFILLSVIVLIPSLSFAAGVTSDKGQVKLINVQREGNFVRVDFSQPIKNPGNCEGASFYIAELSDSSGSNRFYSALLTAYTSKSTVSFWVSGCTKQKYWGQTRPAIFDIYMY